ncbi:MAG: exo-alpha-sialidase, partial [Mycobacteriaceae bacterium]|nr:exo-alpha-sialidase [Mycobacteriaceae bacterium]
GGCVAGPYDANFSESALALRPGSEQLVGGAKAYFAQWSTYKAQHTVSFAFGRRGPETHIVNGFDCVTAGTQGMPPSWTNVTDPNLVWDTRGRIHQLVLAYNAYWGTVKGPNGDVYSVHSDDGGRTWVRDNGGKALEPGPEFSVDAASYLDKPWITANQNPRSPWRDHVYGAWVLFTATGAEIHTAVSRNRGATWSSPQTVKAPQTIGPKNPWPMIGVGPDGVVYLSYVTYGKTSADGATVPATLWLARSKDDGRTWTGFDKVADTTAIASCCVPGTTLHRSIVQYLAVSPDRPGHVYVAWNEVNHGQVDVRLASSADGGRHWSRPVTVNDDRSGAQQFSATVAAGPHGALAVAFYDMRGTCPNSSAILPEHRGKAGTCIGLTLQAYRDHGGAVRAVGGNVLASRHLWDPYQPGQTRGGIGQLACEDPGPTCSNIFLGDYFSMQVSASRVYVLSVSTYPPSSVRADGGGRIHYQQQVLTTVSRRALGI